jgi:tRNA-2-methylthio-N6-dimethylallyladenosine synthase
MNSDRKKRVYVETYGCQMNLADSEIVQSLLDTDGFEMSPVMEEADVLLVNTCAIRENAEQRIYGRLGEFKRLKLRNPEIVVGVLGCMAERLRAKLADEHARGVGQIVDIIIGPDEYRKVPSLIQKAWHGEKGVAVQLSRVETYDDIIPLRTEGKSAWLSVMRGCDKFCTFCVVPFTRGRERSRSLATIVQEVETLSRRGFREVTLLGQNVNSYLDGSSDFSDLMRAVAGVDRMMRVRFTTSHPQDMSEKLIGTIAETPNICKYIHLPVQSGSDRILELMNRTYSTSHYLRLVEMIRHNIPGVSLSTDIISGFPTESEEDHRGTLALIEQVKYDGMYTFKYSPRENTPSYKMGDDVADEVKARRVNEVLALSKTQAEEINRRFVGATHNILLEGESKKSPDEWQGRTDGNKMVIVPKGDFIAGSYLDVRITRSSAATLFGEAA